MADNVAVTEGSGKTIATDDVGGEQYQRVKLADGTADSSTVIAAGNGVHGTSLRVTIASDSTGQVKLAAGTAGIGKLTANSGVDIGDVDVTSVVPGVGATNLGKAEDAAHASGDVGVATMSVRQNTAASLSGADGDYQPLITDTNGRLHVLDANSAAMATSLGNLDNSVDGNYLNVNMNIAGTDIVSGEGTIAAGCQRITIATDDDSVAHLATIAGDTTSIDTLLTNNMVAEDAPDGGNPVKVGGKAVLMDGTVPPDLVSAEGDRTNMQTDMYGRQLVDTSHPFAWSATDANAAAEGPTELKAAPGANLALYITDIIVSNGAVAGSIIFLHTTAGATTIIQPLYFGINSGSHMALKTPIKLPTNVNFGYTSTTMTTHSITVLGYTAYSA